MFPVGLVCEMGRKGGWGQYSGCPGRGHLGSVDLGAGGSLVGIKLVDTQRCCKEIRRELSWGRSVVLGRAREETSKRNVALLK